MADIPRKRRHPAAATRILVGGLATAATFGVIGALAVAEPAPKVTPTATVTTTPPPPVHVVRYVYRYVPVGSPGGTTSSRAPSGATPAPAGVPALQPVTRTRGS